MHILGPSQEYYQALLASFRSTPEPISSLGIFAPIQKAVQEVAKQIQDFLHIVLLDDDDDTTSAENNTSTIILFNIDGHKLLSYIEGLGIPLTDLNFLDVPHHGSKRNINSKIMKKIKAQTAIVSASKDSPKHPAKKVTNALQKHGAKVYVTKGISLLHHHNAPDRGWSAAQAEPFHSLVEE